MKLIKAQNSICFSSGNRLLLILCCRRTYLGNQCSKKQNISIYICIVSNPNYGYFLIEKCMTFLWESKFENFEIMDSKSQWNLILNGFYELNYMYTPKLVLEGGGYLREYGKKSSLKYKTKLSV